MATEYSYPGLTLNEQVPDSDLPAKARELAKELREECEHHTSDCVRHYYELADVLERLADREST